jgi:LacI family transcriptional regulator
MPQPRTTLRDIARRVGVHPSTVSRVLNPETRSMVSEEIALRVTEAATSLGYRPNPIAYGLRTNRSFTVGVLVPDLTNPVFPPIMRGIETTLEAAGYTAILANSDNDAARERTILDAMRGRCVDGLIVATAHRDDPLVAECLAEETPLVLINRKMEQGNVPSVVNDDAAGIAAALDHLAGLGHTRIAHIAGPLTLSTAHARYHGLIAAIKARGIAVDETLFVCCDIFNVDEGRRCCALLLDRGRPFTAIVAAHDLLAVGCYETLAARGLSCPADVSITGYNDIPLVDRLNPPLTTLRTPLHEMGVQAARCLLERIADAHAPAREIVVATELVVRGSTAAPPAALP